MEPAHFEAAAKGDVNEHPFCDIDKPDMSIIFNNVSPSGNTMLHVAAKYNHKDIVELMARRFPELIAKTNNHEDTALHVAARAGNLEIVATLVYCVKQIPTAEAHPSLLKMKNKDGNTALHLAFLSLLLPSHISYPFPSSSDKVLDLEALALHLASEVPEVLYYRCKAGSSPLYLAVESGKKDILEYLLTVLSEVHGSDNRNPQGKSPVHAAIKLKRLDLLKTIVEKKPKLLSLRDEKGNTALHFAASTGYIEGVRYLLEAKSHGCVLKRNGKGLYPLHVACKRGQVEITKELLRKWPDSTELLCNKGRNILHVAAKSGQKEVVSFIMEEGNADELINEMDKDKNTPLHLAVLGSHYSVVGILLWDKRIITSLTNNQGLTAYDIAVQQSEILKIKENVVDEGNSKAVEEQPPKANPKKSRTQRPFKAITTLSIFACQSHRSLSNHCISMENRLRESEEGSDGDVKNRINNLLVVATVIFGATFAASVQIAGSASGGSAFDGTVSHSNSSATSAKNRNGKRELQSFLIYDTLAMHISIVAAFLLCWAQLVANNLASSIVQLVFGLLGVSLYMTSAAFIISNRGFSQITTLIQLLFIFAQGVVLFPFLFVPGRVKEVSILIVCYVLFRCESCLNRLRITCFSRKQNK